MGAAKQPASPRSARRIVGRHYLVTWRWNDPRHERHGELVTTPVFCRVGKAREFWAKHSKSPVVQVRMTYPYRKQP